MEGTSNYQLNQWEKSDRILMEDFNADNAKLDAALAGIRDLLPIVHLKTITTAEAVNTLDIDLSDIDWNKWLYVLIRIDGTMSISSASFYVRMNGYSSEYDYTNTATSKTTFAGYCYLTYGSNQKFPLLLLSSQGSQPDIAIRHHPGTGWDYGKLNKNVSLSTLNLVGSSTSYTIGVGTKISLYGIRL